MSPDDLASALADLGWTPTILAAKLGVDEATARRWQRGNREVPPPVAAWLRKLGAYHAKNPPPPAPDGRGRGRPAGGSLYAAPQAKAGA